MSDPVLDDLEDAVAADLIQEIKGSLVSEFDLRLPVELRERFGRLRWLDVQAARDTLPGSDDLIALSCLVTAILKPRDGILHCVDAMAIIHRTDPVVFEYHDNGPEAVYVKALDNRCPHRFQAKGLYANEDLIAFGERHGWAGEGACWASRRWSQAGGTRYVTDFWFSNPMTAVAARMAF